MFAMYVAKLRDKHDLITRDNSYLYDILYAMSI